MRLYIDDDSVDPGLIRLLRRDGHDVQVPADVGLTGSSDQAHLAHAIRGQRAILTRNYGDFQDLHDLVVSAANGVDEIALYPLREGHAAARFLKALDADVLPVTRRLSFIVHVLVARAGAPVWPFAL